MTQTTGKASSNKTGNKRNVPVKGKRNSQKVNRNAKGVKSKISRPNANAKNGAKMTNKGKGKPNKQSNAPKGKGASGTLSSSAAPAPKDKQASFEKRKSNASLGSKNQKKPKKAVPTLKNGKNAKERTSLSTNYKELLKKIQPTLATLPKFMQGSTRDFALLMLTHCSIIDHKLKVLNKFNTKPEYIPASAKFKFILTCCDDLKNDASQISDAEDVNQGIKDLQILIRDRTKKTVEREIQVFKKKLINDVFYFTFKTMKTGLILFKTKHSNLRFNKSDNYIVKTGILQYFNDQTNNEYPRYFDVTKEMLITHLNKLKDELFNSNDLIPSDPTVQAATAQTEEGKTNETSSREVTVAALDTSKTTITFPKESIKYVEVSNGKG